MRQNRRGFITVIEVMIILLVVAIASTLHHPFRNRPRTPSAKKCCVSNMKTIEGAVELYLMEKNVAGGTRIDLETLQAEGYLKSIPLCPKHGHYTIRVNSPSGITAGATEIRCSIHNTIDDTTAGL